MADDIVTRLRDVTEMNWDGDEVTEPLCGEAADEIERLRTLCNDLYHDATCIDPYCLLCGAGIQEWEARRG